MSRASPPEKLETRRLILRKPRSTDAPALFERFATDVRVTKYLSWTPHRDANATRDFVERCIQLWEEAAEYTWYLTVKPSDSPVGALTFWPTKARAELGYALAYDCWGQGYMAEAVQPVVDWALDVAGYHRVWATCDVENVGSERVMQKVGMNREGRLRAWQAAPNIGPESRDSWSYAITKWDRT
jgi:[ribosomal protein S5]-alanine N-acetyltransferase